MRISDGKQRQQIEWRCLPEIDLAFLQRRRGGGRVGHDAEFHAIDIHPLSASETAGRFVTWHVVGIARINDAATRSYFAGDEAERAGATISITGFSAGFIASRSRMMNGGSVGADSGSSTIAWATASRW